MFYNALDALKAFGFVVLVITIFLTVPILVFVLTVGALFTLVYLIYRDDRKSTQARKAKHN